MACVSRASCSTKSTARKSSRRRRERLASRRGPGCVTRRQIAKYRGRNDGGPNALAIADRRLRDVARLHDLVGQLPDILALVVTDVGIEIDSERGGEHRRGKILGVVAGLLIGLAETLVLRQIAVLILVGRNRA